MCVVIGSSARFSYTETMKQHFNPERLDARAFALSASELGGDLPLGALKRIVQECLPTSSERHVSWRAQGEMRLAAGGLQQFWLHLEAACSVELTCQRCLAPVETRLVVGRWFRFVADEASATAQDDGCEEDLLVMSGEFSVLELLEDELVLELPLIARHVECPVQPKLQVADAGFVSEQPARTKPFAALAGLKLAKLGNLDKGG